ncbi:hypothetical protein M4I32_10700 [Microbacterium sp. LRZ72]|uniref:hypothetical protein n=1 Tax=Microbacterium sp. LRZ72 TaxID=2942481 RepID=UPI0029A9E04D|nr:hypothetical protein [Microbacterium sp. LRZ72]MDX2377268.1 hypothetical protein [Microbacterium sp. LRZ72]
MHKPARTALASLIVSTVIVLGGCSADNGAGSTGGSDSTPAAVEVEENLVSVDVRVARSLVDPDGSLEDDDIVAAAADQGMTAVVDGDSVVYTMSKQQRDEMLAEMRSSAQDSIDDMVSDTSNSVTGVEVNDAMTSFRVSVDGQQFSPLEGMLVLGFYIQGALYQQFAGASPDDVEVTVDFVDDATGDVLESGSYQEWRKNLEQ